MVTPVSIAEIGALLGDPARAAMLQALMDGRALTASELAEVAGITRQTASGHLSRLADAALVSVSRQGRHRYHRLATAEIGRLLESVMLVASGRAVAHPRTGPRDAGMRLARSCYDHVAGWLGVRLADALVERRWVEIGEEVALVTNAGLDGLARLGIPIADDGRGRHLCRPCLDWSERRPHLAGRLGSAILRHGLDHDWIRRTTGSRALAVTPTGWRALHEAFDIRPGPDK